MVRALAKWPQREGLLDVAASYPANVDNPCFVGMIPAFTARRAPLKAPPERNEF